jgi:hypothetical protein
MVKAEVQVKNCIIAGVVVGNVTATESVEITKEGRMVGDIAAPRVIIVDGASFRGRIDMGEVDVGAGERRTPSAQSRPGLTARPAARPVAPARPAARPAPEARKAEEKAAPAAVVARPAVPPAPVAMGAVKRKVLVKTRK